MALPRRHRVVTMEANTPAENPGPILDLGFVNDDGNDDDVNSGGDGSDAPSFAYDADRNAVSAPTRTDGTDSTDGIDDYGSAPSFSPSSSPAMRTPYPTSSPVGPTYHVGPTAPGGSNVGHGSAATNPNTNPAMNAGKVEDTSAGTNADRNAGIVGLIFSATGLPMLAFPLAVAAGLASRSVTVAILTGIVLVGLPSLVGLVLGIVGVVNGVKLHRKIAASVAAIVLSLAPAVAAGASVWSFREITTIAGQAAAKISESLSTAGSLSYSGKSSSQNGGSDSSDFSDLDSSTSDDPVYQQVEE